MESPRVRIPGSDRCLHQLCQKLWYDEFIQNIIVWKTSISNHNMFGNVVCLVQTWWCCTWSRWVDGSERMARGRRCSGRPHSSCTALPSRLRLRTPHISSLLRSLWYYWFKILKSLINTRYFLHFFDKLVISALQGTKWYRTELLSRLSSNMEIITNR